MRIERFLKRSEGSQDCSGTYHCVRWKLGLGSYIGYLPRCCDKCPTKAAEGRRGSFWLRVLRVPTEVAAGAGEGRATSVLSQEVHCRASGICLFGIVLDHERLLLTFRVDLLTPWTLIWIILRGFAWRFIYLEIYLYYLEVIQKSHPVEN